jgi:hypothetical protein
MCEGVVSRVGIAPERRGRTRGVEPRRNRTDVEVDTFPQSYYPRVVAQGGLKHPPWRWFPSRGVGFDSQSVVHGNPELLLASEVVLRRLNRDVAE